MTGKIEWIGVRPERRAEIVRVDRVNVDLETGLSGDHDSKPHRQVTIISSEQMRKVAERLGRDAIDPAATRRNIMIAGIDFDQLKDQKLQLGTAEIEITGYCHPCSRMEENLGEGGRLAMAHLAGYTAKVIRSGDAGIGDEVRVLD